MVAGSVGRTQPGVAHLRRAPLDGLRALAVTAVVVYHFGGGNGSILGGGFLGVDLFFVLSGYLITGLLVQEYRRNGSIDLFAFWARRLRRLLPALVLMVLAVCAATWWFARPETWAALRSDVFWTLAYLANWHFVAVGEDYFAGYIGASPLRHTWSLAIEEQFYAVWPLVVAGVLALGARRRPPGERGGRHLLGLAVVLVLLSAAAMAWQYDSGSLSRARPAGRRARVGRVLKAARAGPARSPRHRTRRSARACHNWGSPVSYTPVARTIWWEAVVISLTAALPPWIVSAVVLDVLFPIGSTRPKNWLLHYLSVPAVSS